MKIHEYQAKELLKKFGVPVSTGKVIFKAEEASGAVKEIGNPPFIIKAQIHAGGRGKGGGVKKANSVEEAIEVARKMLGMKLVTPQTGPDGKIVKRVLIDHAVDIKKELYLGITVDRAKRCPIIMASLEGGVEIEKVAAEKPDAIIKGWVLPDSGFMPFIARRISYALGFNGSMAGKMTSFIGMLYSAFDSTDCLLVEINPLVITADDDLLALDAKMNIDDNALYRHPEIVALRDLDEENPLEVEAAKYKLNYIKLDGTVGCLVNGAGLAMATMDLIKLAGAMPANFLDIGGAANIEAMTNAFRILTSDPDIKVVLINVFGGMIHCDRVVTAMIESMKVVDVKVPIVVRFEGTNAKKALEMLDSVPGKFIPAVGMRGAAEKVAEALKGKE